MGVYIQWVSWLPINLADGFGLVGDCAFGPGNKAGSEGFLPMVPWELRMSLSPMIED